MELNWTKVENTEGKEVLEASLTAELLSISEKVLEFNNEKKTQYRVCTVKLEDGQQVSAVMYEKNYQHGVEVGTVYSCKAIFDEEKNAEEVFLTISHLTAARRLKAASLGITAIKTAVKETTEEAVTAEIAPEALT